MFTILIVEDNRADRLGIRGLTDWEQLGNEVAGLAVDGEDGYKQAVQVRPRNLSSFLCSRCATAQ